MMVSHHIPSWPDLPATFESLNGDTLGLILRFVGDKSYKSFGGLSKHCKEVYLTSGMTKETYLFGYAPFSVITGGYERDGELDWESREALSKGVVFYNRNDVLEWAFEERKKCVLNTICRIAAEEERFDILDEVLINVEQWNDKGFIFGIVGDSAAVGGKLNVLEWLEDKRLDIDKGWCAEEAAYHGQLHIIQWLQEEKGLKLKRKLYYSAIRGCQLHVMKWLKEQNIRWTKWTFSTAALGDNLDILQWLHDEGCPWDNVVGQDRVKPEVVEWCRSNGYGDRIFFRGHWYLHQREDQMI